MRQFTNIFTHSSNFIYIYLIIDMNKYFIENSMNKIIYFSKIHKLYRYYTYNV